MGERTKSRSHSKSKPRLSEVNNMSENLTLELRCVRCGGLHQSVACIVYPAFCKILCKKCDMFHNTADHKSARSKNPSPARPTAASQNISQTTMK